ncbi:MAG: hypothetical protein ACJAZT_002012 [Gammaproteobacteria bacterium]|jgi:hypothetical protein
MDIFHKLAARSGHFLILFAFMPTAQAALISDLFISEVMVNPSEVSDSNGEWFELFNPTTESVDLNQTFIQDDGSNSHQISHIGPLLILPNQYFVLARNGNTLTNGGFIADYVYSNFTLGNSGDEIILSDGVSELLRLDYGSGFSSAGISTELVSTSATGSNYALTPVSFVYGEGDVGTPGSSGSMQFSASSIPEPSTVLLFMVGLYGLRRFKYID